MRRFGLIMFVLSGILVGSVVAAERSAKQLFKLVDGIATTGRSAEQLVGGITTTEQSTESEQLFKDGFRASEADKHKEAAEYYKKSCDLKYGRACFELGRYYEGAIGGVLGVGVPRDWERALELYEQACYDEKGPFEDACYKLASMYRLRDKNMEVKAYEKLCENGNVEGCYYAGRRSHYDLLDTDRALKNLKRCCELSPNSQHCKSTERIKKDIIEYSKDRKQHQRKQ